eukprot:scaffold223239_cov26-Tisochrysis_lutea.AAC.1
MGRQGRAGRRRNCGRARKGAGGEKCLTACREAQVRCGLDATRAGVSAGCARQHVAQHVNVLELAR